MIKTILTNGFHHLIQINSLNPCLDSTTTNGTDTVLSTIANRSEDFKTIEVLTDGKRNKIPETVKNTKLKILKTIQEHRQNLQNIKIV